MERSNLQNKHQKKWNKQNKSYLQIKKNEL